MGKKHICFVILFLIITCFVKNTAAYNDTITHPDITERAAEPANSQLAQYLKDNLGFKAGIGTLFSLNSKNKTIKDWLRDGAELEDDPMCRATNHFHNPLLPWDQSFMSDDTTPLGLIIRAYCELQGWTYANRRSNVTWATGYLAPAPDGPKDPFNVGPDYTPLNWDKAREYYYNALTSTLEEDRETYFALTFNAVGHVMHLLEDVSVPAHVRNDFTSHLKFNEVNTWNPTKWFGNRFEYYVKKRPSLVTGAQPTPDDFPSFTDLRLTDFWDTDQYTGSNPDVAVGNSIGIAEYTNANFLSGTTIFRGTEEDPAHSFPYPSPSLVVEYEEIDATGKKRTYLKKLGYAEGGYGETIEHLAAGKWFYQLLPSNLKRFGLKLDEKVYADYASFLIPRAVGYSAGLLDYFFRGEIEISLPDTGVYNLTANPAQGFTNITLLAKNVTPNAEEMIDGSIELVVKHKIALEDPFQSYPVPTTVEFYYIVVPEANNIRSIPRNSTVELTFDLSQTPIPLYATDVYLQVVYKGRLGQEDGAVAVGFKDISEPTPTDLFNNMDMTCLNGNWYAAGSPEAIAQVDTNQNGIADEWDVYPHDLTTIYIRFSPFNDPQYASPTAYNFQVSDLAAGDFLRALFILSDDQFNYSFYNIGIGTDPADPWTHLDRSLLFPGTAIKNQTDYPDVRFYPVFYPFRGSEMWWGGGVILINAPYPSDSCPYDLLSFGLDQPAYSQRFEVQEVREDLKEVVLRDRETGEEWVAREGEDIGGWRIVEINRNHVTILKPGERNVAIIGKIPVMGGE